MLVLLLRTFKYIFSYFSPLKNECASECAQHSSALSIFRAFVDEWLTLGWPRHTASATPIMSVPRSTRSSIRQLALLFNGSLALSFHSSVGHTRVVYKSLNWRTQQFRHSGVLSFRSLSLGMFARPKLSYGEHFLQGTPSYLTYASGATTEWLTWYANGQSRRAALSTTLKLTTPMTPGPNSDRPPSTMAVGNPCRPLITPPMSLTVPPIPTRPSFNFVRSTQLTLFRSGTSRQWHIPPTTGVPLRLARPYMNSLSSPHSRPNMRASHFPLPPVPIPVPATDHPTRHPTTLPLPHLPLHPQTSSHFVLLQKVLETMQVSQSIMLLLLRLYGLKERNRFKCTIWEWVWDHSCCVDDGEQVFARVRFSLSSFHFVLSHPLPVPQPLKNNGPQVPTTHRRQRPTSAHHPQKVTSAHHHYHRSNDIGRQASTTSTNDQSVICHRGPTRHDNGRSTRW